MVDNLDKLFKCQQSFIIRWKSANKLATTEGVTKNTWRICVAKKGLDKRLFWVKERKLTHLLLQSSTNGVIEPIKDSTNIDYLFIVLDWLVIIA